MPGPDPEQSAGPPPPEAVSLFGPELPRVVRYVEWLSGAGIARGLLGPREVPRLWDRHILNCVAVAELIPRASAVCDVGSGAGLPGIVIALARPDVTVTLLEPSARRCRFLTDVVDDLELSTVSVCRARAENVAGSIQCDVVVARALAPLDRLARWCMPLVRPGGELLALKGLSASRELVAASAALAAAGAHDCEVTSVPVGAANPSTWVVRMRRPSDRPIEGRRQGGLASRGHVVPRERRVGPVRRRQ